ncbi:hypothetical protein CW745_01110 [Psychromonas sp. psych-6C06]|uniref:tetratricopeptide repeat protein n=1 Tax=Psychromonas sp. psych-6C06 TaxID=2058089 RepID=UPI000C322411|nr:tetratricopeptide repeat protein [Psychromonas sp. psych-6C06]PKF63478.1 hypothetical protein CW745_01110 [Psychromonas sp. psych-6C06]
MFYTKLTIQALLIALLCACNSTPPVEQTEPTTNEKESAESTKIELAVYTKALIALNNGELEKAQQLFTKMSELQPDIAGSWANLAVISVKQERYDDAQKQVATALQKNPKMVQSLNLAGNLAQRRGEILKAKSYYQEALNYQPKYALAHYNLALLYDIYLQDIANAVTHYQLYLDNIDSKDETTTQWLAGLRATLGNQ